MHRDDPHTPPPRTVAAARPAPTRPTGVRWLALLVSLALLLVVLACGGPVRLFGTTEQAAYVQCPLPTPLPWGVEGPRKPGCTCLDGTTECLACWYDLYEQEGGPPDPIRVPSSRFTFREPVTLEPFTLAVDVGYGAPVTGPEPAGHDLVLVMLHWHNPTSAPLTATDDLTATLLLTPTLAPAGPVSITYASALQVTSVAGLDGTWQQGAWTVNAESVALFGRGLPDTIPSGDSRHILPILIPRGEVRELALQVPYLGHAADADDPLTVRFARDQIPVFCP
jgi:hypothetical protein